MPDWCLVLLVLPAAGRHRHDTGVPAALDLRVGLHWEPRAPIAALSRQHVPGGHECTQETTYLDRHGRPTCRPAGSPSAVVLGRETNGRADAGPRGPAEARKPSTGRVTSAPPPQPLLPPAQPLPLLLTHRALPQAAPGDLSRFRFPPGGWPSGQVREQGDEQAEERHDPLVDLSDRDPRRVRVREVVQPEQDLQQDPRRVFRSDLERLGG